MVQGCGFVVAPIHEQGRIMGLLSPTPARRVMDVFRKRLENYGLTLHPDL
jgi:hypothetical protein